MLKTKGLFYRLLNSDHSILPPIQWSEIALELLGAAIGTNAEITTAWNTIYRKFKNIQISLSTRRFSYGAKSLLTKTKLLPVLSCTAVSYPLPSRILQKAITSTEIFFCRSDCLWIPNKVLASPFDRGGYNAAHTPTYRDLFFMRPIASYASHRVHNQSSTPKTGLIEN